ncbi:MAG: PEP-CTERM sorting domain-containing protein [Verrucomicrobia bacterium]|nr:MAG: PEP-CTERM sorting domain-containing protein [Verrucomicrobiota bacterium]
MNPQTNHQSVLSRSFLNRPSIALGALAMSAIIATSASAMVSYYIGVDNRTTIPSGTYMGLANPNFGNLTFLYAHTYTDTPNINHYHSKSTIVYTGPNLGAGTATVNTTNNFLPEGSAPPLLLQAGVGAYADKLVNIPDPANPFSMLDVEDTAKLSSFPAGTPEHFLFTSSAMRWVGSIAGADVHMKLVSATPGLFFGTGTDPNVNPFEDADGLHLEDSFRFSLFPWVANTAAPGDYRAVFELEDERPAVVGGPSPFGDSGRFEFRFRVIPEPSGAALTAIAGALMALRRRRNR